MQLESEPEPVVEEKEEEKEEEVLAATMTKVFLKPKEIDDKDLLYFKFKFTFKVQNKKGLQYQVVKVKVEWRQTFKSLYLQKIESLLKTLIFATECHTPLIFPT